MGRVRNSARRQGERRGHKRLLRPWVGALTVDFEVLIPLQDPDQRLVIYRAADTASQAALDALTREIADRVPALRALIDAPTNSAPTLPAEGLLGLLVPRGGGRSALNRD